MRAGTLDDSLQQSRPDNDLDFVFVEDGSWIVRVQHLVLDVVPPQEVLVKVQISEEMLRCAFEPGLGCWVDLAIIDGCIHGCRVRIRGIGPVVCAAPLTPVDCAEFATLGKTVCESENAWISASEVWTCCLVADVLRQFLGFHTRSIPWSSEDGPVGVSKVDERGSRRSRLLPAGPVRLRGPLVVGLAPGSLLGWSRKRKN